MRYFKNIVFILRSHYCLRWRCDLLSPFAKFAARTTQFWHAFEGLPFENELNSNLNSLGRRSLALSLSVLSVTSVCDLPLTVSSYVTSFAAAIGWAISSFAVGIQILFLQLNDICFVRLYIILSWIDSIWSFGHRVAVSAVLNILFYVVRVVESS